MTIAATKTNDKATVTLHNGGIAGNRNVIVSWRCIKNGKPSGKTFTKRFDNEDDAKSFYERK